jgi:hypothetical protein
MKGLIIIMTHDPIGIANPVIPRLDRGIQKATGCPLKTCGHDALAGKSCHYVAKFKNTHKEEGK